jgi:hypothetical protein
MANRQHAAVGIFFARKLLTKTIMKISYYTLLVAFLISVTGLARAEEPKRPAAAVAASSEVKGYKNVGVEEFDKLRQDKKM